MKVEIVTRRDGKEAIVEYDYGIRPKDYFKVQMNFDKVHLFKDF